MSKSELVEGIYNKYSSKYYEYMYSTIGQRGNKREHGMYLTELFKDVRNSIYDSEGLYYTSKVGKGKKMFYILGYDSDEEFSLIEVDLYKYNMRLIVKDSSSIKVRNTGVYLIDNNYKKILPKGTKNVVERMMRVG